LLRILCVLLGWLASHGTAGAHDPGLSTMSVTRTADRIEVSMAFNAQDGRLLNLRPSPDARAAAPEICALTVGGDAITATSAEVTLGENEDLVLWIAYAGDWNGLMEVHSKAFEQLPHGHRQYASVKDGDGTIIATALLGANQPMLVARGTERVQEHGSTAAAFFVLGLEHIFTGYDHLLFLFALLLVCSDFRSAAVIITCFTLAHSLTLALAVLQVVNVPSQVVEVVIAASIVYVGIENLLRKKQFHYRWLLTIAFGLIHGLGFATVLREAALGSGEKLITSLISFNLGVEAGQIAIAAILLPIIFRLRKKESFQGRWVPAASTLICLAGSWWILERTLLSR
jgi:hydrogenase/urease accessory protein HupE